MSKSQEFKTAEAEYKTALAEWKKVKTEMNGLLDQYSTAQKRINEALAEYNN